VRLPAEEPTPVVGLFGRLPVIDAHVHVFPDPVFAAVWRWFDEHAWKIRYRFESREVARFLRQRGVTRGVALHYAHKPGMARELNSYAQVLGRLEPWFIPCATVFPGEPEARALLDHALGPGGGCRGIKIHCHVQQIAPDDRRLDDVYAAAAAHGVPVVIHAGDAPALPASATALAALCSPAALEHALRRHPRTTFVVPHLFASQMEVAGRFLDDFEHLHLDTTMALAGYLPLDPATGDTDTARAREWRAQAVALVRRHAPRILYGSDFPNLPYEWDRELRFLASLDLPEVDLAAILAGNAARLFRL
jgi:predicted TIM-barrel fold metal-dependent hydrolase